MRRRGLSKVIPSPNNCSYNKAKQILLEGKRPSNKSERN
jgi:hypothetical protein